MPKLSYTLRVLSIYHIHYLVGELEEPELSKFLRSVLSYASLIIDSYVTKCPIHAIFCIILKVVSQAIDNLPSQKLGVLRWPEMFLTNLINALEGLLLSNPLSSI